MTKEIKIPPKYVMVESCASTEEDEIDLIEFISILLQSWKKILATSIMCTGFALLYDIYSPEVFKAETIVTGAKEERNDPPFLLGEIEGLAAMAGISIPYNSNIDLIVKTIESRNFLKNFIVKYNVDFSYYESNNQGTFNKVKILQDCLNLNIDQRSDVIEISLRWFNANDVHTILNNLILFTNEHFRQKAIINSTKRLNYLTNELTKTTLQDMRAVLFKLIASEKQKSMLANVNEDFALEVIDPAFYPESPEKPSRGLIILLGIVCGGFLGIFTVFFIKFLQKLKNRPSNKVSL